MSFKAKVTAVMLVVLTLIYGWYFIAVLSEASTTPVEDIFYQGFMLATVILLVVVSAISISIVAIVGRKEADDEDERDRLFEMRGDQVGSYVLAVAVLLGLGLAMIEGAYFWIANVLLAGLVLSELVKALVMLYAYRRGY